MDLLPLILIESLDLLEGWSSKYALNRLKQFITIEECLPISIAALHCTFYPTLQVKDHWSSNPILWATSGGMIYEGDSTTTTSTQNAKISPWARYDTLKQNLKFCVVQLPMFLIWHSILWLKIKLLTSNLWDHYWIDILCWPNISSNFVTECPLEDCRGATFVSMRFPRAFSMALYCVLQRDQESLPREWQTLSTVAGCWRYVLSTDWYVHTFCLAAINTKYHTMTTTYYWVCICILHFIQIPKKGCWYCPLYNLAHSFPINHKSV